MNELGQRMQRAVQADPEWWLSHVKKAAPGKPVPYDQRLGLSRSEWEEFLELSDKMTVKKTADAVLHVTMKGDSIYVLHGGASLPDLTGIEIDLTDDVVRTPFGVAQGGLQMNIEHSALGAWNGAEWHLEDVSSAGIRGTIVTFSVGKLKPSGRGLIHYDVKQNGFAGQTRIRQILFFNVPARNGHVKKSAEAVAVGGIREHDARTNGDMATDSPADTGRPAAVRSSASSSRRAEMRTWTDNTGKHKTEGEFVGLVDDAVRLKRADGKVVTVPMVRLSDADQAYVREICSNSHAGLSAGKGS